MFMYVGSLHEASLYGMHTKMYYIRGRGDAPILPPPLVAPINTPIVVAFVCSDESNTDGAFDYFNIPFNKELISVVEFNLVWCFDTV